MHVPFNKSQLRLVRQLADGSFFINIVKKMGQGYFYLDLEYVHLIIVNLYHKAS